MALVSPGLEITVTDEAQYLPTALGTIPFVLLATAENKTVNGVVAPGTTKANAGKVYGISSQRELISTFGYPKFRQSSAGTPLHGNELNEYGLMAAYSALGLGNRVWVVRADVNLDDLVGSSVRPSGKVPNGTVWLDTSTTNFGLYSYNRSSDTFTKIDPILVTSVAELQPGQLVPRNSIGQIGSYAVVVANVNNFVYYKTKNNEWTPVGSSDWADAFPIIASNTSTVSLPAGSAFKINGINIYSAAAVTDLLDLATLIENNVDTITAEINSDGRLELYSAGDITVEEGELQVFDVVNVETGSDYTIVNVGNTDWNALAGTTGVTYATGDVFTADVDGTAGTTGTVTRVADTNLESIGIRNNISGGAYKRAAVTFGTYAQVPQWSEYDEESRPTNSIWVKTSVQGSGVNFTVKRYNSNLEAWATLAMPVYRDGFAATYGLDPVAGGTNIAAGSSFIKYNESGNLGYAMFTLGVKGQTKVTGTTVPGATAFASGDDFTVYVSVPGSATPVQKTCNIVGTDARAFVASILAADIPNVTAQVEASGSISITHRTGGVISLVNGSNSGRNPITIAGFTLDTPGVESGLTPYAITLSNWKQETEYTFSNLEPNTAPANGTPWYYNDPTAVDIMICETDGWRGYKNTTRDPRGYNLSLTNPDGVIISPVAPTRQSGTNGGSLVPGDLWLDSSDLENYPVLYRYTNQGTWSKIDNTDKISQNGIVFADARWGTNGSVNPITDPFPSTVNMLTSNYVDLDAPDYRLFPRGTLLFNTRRSGYTVKKFVQNYFNTQSFNVSIGQLPAQTNAWVTDLGLKADGSPNMGHLAQRDFVVQALKAAVDGNIDIREEGYNFNLLAAPGYPELVVNLVALNNDRANTGFIIGDTPMTMPATITDINAYENSFSALSDPYTGLFYPSGLSTDLSGNEIAVPASHMMLRTFLHSDNVSYQWFAPAGTRRGLIDNATALGYVNPLSGNFMRSGISQQLRDALYERRMNPITLLPGAGIVAYGQKTRATAVGGGGTSMDRINVARLVNYLRVVLRGVANQFLFEPNDKITRDQIKQMVESMLNDLIAKRGLYDYLVVCDETNNTPDRVARNELYVDIAIEPMKAVEFIYIPIRLKNPGTIAGGAATTNV